MSKVSIVIPNYNGEKCLRECLASLKKQDYRDFDVIVVDNCSEDASLQVIGESEGELLLEVIPLDNNYGFAKAVNDGIKASGSEYVILLNNDAVAGRHMVGALVNRLEKEPDVFSAQAMMLQYNNRKLIDSAGDYFCVLGWGFARGRDEAASKYTGRCDIFSACAGAAIYRRKVFDEIGYFDENFFAYLEDVDIGYRAKIYGWRNVYEPEAKALHIGSAASGSRHNAFKVSLSARNSMLLMYKNFAPWQKVLNFVPVCAGILVKIVYFARKGLAGAYLKGIFSSFFKMKDVRMTLNLTKNSIAIEKELLRNTLRRLGI